MKLSVKKGDTVKILTGKDRGKSGKVIRSLPKQNKAVVEGVNLVKKHRKPTKSNEKGQIVDVPMPIHVSNLKIENPKLKAKGQNKNSKKAVAKN